jgi:hypothetical protein
MARQWHPDWCAQDHRCTAGRVAGEHRADPHTVRVPGAGSFVLTRVRTDATGIEHAEITLSITLPPGEVDARTRLAALLTHLRLLIGPPRATRTGHTTALGDRPHRTAA